MEVFMDDFIAMAGVMCLAFIGAVTLLFHV